MIFIVLKFNFYNDSIDHVIELIIECFVWKIHFHFWLNHNNKLFFNLQISNSICSIKTVMILLCWRWIEWKGLKRKTVFIFLANSFWSNLVPLSNFMQILKRLIEFWMFFPFFHFSIIVDFILRRFLCIVYTVDLYISWLSTMQEIPSNDHFCDAFVVL